MQGTQGSTSTYVAIDGMGSADGDTGNNNGMASIDAIQEIRVPRFNDANHEPVVRIVGARDLEARSGATVNLRGAISDPDKNRVTRIGGSTPTRAPTLAT